MKNINVNINGKSSQYEILIDSGFIAEHIRKYISEGAYFIIDEKVGKLYKDIIPQERVYFYKASEKNKSLKYAEQMLSFLVSNGCLRDSVLVSIGGGITGDIAAFTASLYMRGIKLIQVPTTFLSMLDSSVGGKTAVNFKGIKNNVGTFYQPSKVLIDIDFLKTLTKKEYLNGFAEAIKIACISSPELFSFLSLNRDKILLRDVEVLKDLIHQSCSLKVKIVEEDEKESGIRKLLNFGHTIGHGIESDSHHKISHGYAVVLGIVYEMEYALRNNKTDRETYNRIISLLKSYGYPVEYKVKDISVFETALGKDKKAGKNGISLAVSGFNMMGTLINNVQVKELIDLFL